MGSSDEMYQKKLSENLDEIKTIQKDLQKAMAAKQTLDSQLSENNIVLEELEFLTPENKVYKMTGTVLVEQKLEEAKENVQKRLMFINSEIKRQEESLKDLSEKDNKLKESFEKLSKEFSERQKKFIKQ